jgi:hypothetical protein
MTRKMRIRNGSFHWRNGRRAKPFPPGSDRIDATTHGARLLRIAALPKTDKNEAKSLTFLQRSSHPKPKAEEHASPETQRTPGILASNFDGSDKEHEPASS